VTVDEAAKRLGLAWQGSGSRVIEAVFAGDMLGHALARIPPNAAWVTVQKHVNVIAVAVQTGAACVVLADGMALDAEAQAAAAREGVAVLITDMPAAQVVVRLAALLQGGVGAGEL